MEDSAGLNKVTCPSCGQEVVAGAYCRRCGERLAAAEATTVAGPLSPPLHAETDDADAGTLTPVVVSDADDDSLPSHQRPRRGLLIGVVSLVAVGVGAGAFWALTGNGGEESTLPSREPVASSSTRPASSEVAPDSPPSTTPVSSVPAPTTTDVVTTTVEPFWESSLRVSLESGEPFRYSYPTIEELPDLPTELPGFVPYDGEDAFGKSGIVRTSTIRIFEGADAFMPLVDFSSQMNGCGDSFWVARWVVKNPDVQVLALNTLDPALSAGGYVESEPWLVPPAAPAGLMGASICTVPGFEFDSAVNGNTSNLVDVVVEWTYFDRDPFVASEESAAPAPPACDQFFANDYLPLELCDRGGAVAAVQQALGVDSDGYYGPATQQAVRQFQEGWGIPATGAVDRLTWSYMGPDYPMILD